MLLQVKTLIKLSALAGLLANSPVFARATCIPSDLLLRQIERTAKAYSIAPNLLKAISAVESCHGKYLYNAKTRDYGLMQINIHTARAMKLNISRLMHDHAYSLDSAAQILVALRANWPTTYQCRYNIGTSKALWTHAACKRYLERLKSAGYIAPLRSAK